MSPRHFFITGRPRSRTAWLANLLTWSDALCLHDALRTLSDPRQLAELFAGVGPQFRAVGMADPAALFFQDALRETFPGAQWILIDRDPRECAQSLRRAVQAPIADAAFAAIEEQYARARRIPGVVIVPFPRLSELAAWIGHVAIGPHFTQPAARLRELERMQVQIHPRRLLSEVALGLPAGLAAHVEVAR